MAVREVDVSMHLSSISFRPKTPNTKKNNGRSFFFSHLYSFFILYLIRFFFSCIAAASYIISYDLADHLTKVPFFERVVFD